MKIVDKLREYERTSTPFFSLEFFPPKTAAGLHNLYGRLDRMAALEPAFIDITWGAGGSTQGPSLELSRKTQEYFGLEVMLHLTCTDMPTYRLESVLNEVKDAGISNILALRGDPPKGKAGWQPCDDGFRYAADLTAFINKKFSGYFGVGVAGYPEGHVETPSAAVALEHLKQKVAAGADFIITQLFYDIEAYKNFVISCRSAGIECPIIPGLLPIQTYDRFRRFTDFCDIKVPASILEALEPIKLNDEAVRRYGIELSTKMCQQLRELGAPGFHFYTLNLESSVSEIVHNLGLVARGESHRALPWRPSAHPGRASEDVRPIFWSNRPKSYLARTMSWDDFPNGRWGDARSPSFGDLSEYYLMRRGIGLEQTVEHRLSKWGSPQDEEALRQVFVNFCTGKLDRLPWCEVPVQGETSKIAAQLVTLNKAGFLTINSQPQVCNAPSDDPVVGWGEPGGYISQKAYVEFFVDARRLKDLIKELDKYPTLTYQAMNGAGESLKNADQGSSLGGVNALTWGVFPGREVVQPTVVDPEVFLVWKDEAFALWLDEWAVLYESNSKSRCLIEEIHRSWFLINVVENNYVDGDIFAPFGPLI